MRRGTDGNIIVLLRFLGVATWRPEDILTRQASQVPSQLRPLEHDLISARPLSISTLSGRPPTRSREDGPALQAIHHFSQALLTRSAAGSSRSGWVPDSPQSRERITPHSKPQYIVDLSLLCGYR